MEHHPRIEPMLGETGEPVIFAPLCRSIITARALMAKMFGPLCSDPGSEMLFDLYWRDSQGLKTSLTSLCLASKASEMTGRGCLAEMEAQAIVERVPDPTDKRRTHVRLTVAGREKMDTLFSAILSERPETHGNHTVKCGCDDHADNAGSDAPFSIRADDRDARPCGCRR